MTPARVAAARVLYALANGRTTLAAEIDAVRDDLSDRRDRALLVELTTGALRWRNELDAAIAAVGQRAVARVDPAALAVLRLGAYQLRHLDRVPAHAVIHDSVDVVRALGAPQAAGFVNAVLRALVRRQHAIALPKRPVTPSREAQIRYLTTTLSHPAWLVRRWLDRYGFDAAERWCQFNNASPAISIRPIGGVSADDLLSRLRDEGIAAESSAFVRDAIALAPGALGRVSAALAETFQVQDEGAQLVARYAGVHPGDRVLDVCAAPGGKTLVLAHDLGTSASSSLVAADRRAARVSLLARTLARAGLQVPVVALDALGGLPFRDVFTCVVLDVPCSGLGTLRRDPDLKWSRTEGDLPRLAADAARMLENAAALVAPGGRLVYATCSSEPDENIDVVRAFLASMPAFALIRPGTAQVPSAVVTEEGCLVTTPFEHGLDAFFAATLVRRRGA
jgi:16S rRNA (cytosine967-C5)-methyltransferase